MLTPEENRLLTQTGPGTPCGELLRRYWQPVCYTAELTKEDPARPITVMGEDLVIFRLPDGRYGCLEEHCAHRCASLAYGFAEPDGLRCAYHGWKYSLDGQCVEQPFEPSGSGYKHRIRLQAYPAQALGGLVFIYMGPTPAPLLPRWDVLAWTDGCRRAMSQEPLACNWLQAQENASDVTHTYFLHSHVLYELGDRGNTVMRLYRPFERYGFQPFEWGQLKGWQYGADGDTPAELAAGNPLIFPNMVRTIEHPFHAMHWRVPINDTRTAVFWMGFHPGGGQSSPEELANPPLEHHPPQKRPDGRYEREEFWAQDRMAWETQGAVLDRSREHLGASDRGIILFRQMLKDEIERAQRGEDPMGVIREPVGDVIELPMWVVDDRGPTGEDFAAKHGMSKLGQGMSRYFDDRQEWFDVPEGAARVRRFMGGD